MFDQSILTMTTILAGMQDSLLVLKSSKDGWKVHESLVGTHPQSIALILLIRTEHTAEHSAEAYGKQMMVVVVVVDKLG